MMCCLFGLLDVQGQLTSRQKQRYLTVLARECEVRGTDATGIAYNFGGKLRIYKRAKAAHEMQFCIPKAASFIMGHTRMTTQGDGTGPRNYNNHPFFGRCRNRDFALAHNGVLWNDKELRRQWSLGECQIETDSYVAVQLLESAKTLDFDSLQFMAEHVEGSFTFTVLDSQDNLYIIKGSNPLSLVYLPKLGIYLYASTDEILNAAMKKLGLLRQPHDPIPIYPGDIMRIARDGTRTTVPFLLSVETYPGSRSLYFSPPALCPAGDDEEAAYRLVLQLANRCGYGEDLVQSLLNDGLTLDEITDWLYMEQFEDDYDIPYYPYAYCPAPASYSAWGRLA